MAETQAYQQVVPSAATQSPQVMADAAQGNVMRAMGQMEVVRYDQGMPVFSWKSNQAQPPMSFMQKYFGQETITAMGIGSALLMGLKLTGLMFHVPAAAAAAGVAGSILPFGLTIAAVMGGATLVGGFLNGQRMEKQRAEGFEFEPPSFPNKGMAQGLMHGMVTGAGMTMLGGVLLHAVVGGATTGVAGFLAQAATVMAPTAMGTALTGAAAVTGVFLLPAIMAVGVGAYMAYKQGKQYETLKQAEYEHAAHIFSVQEGRTQAPARVQELENHLAQTRTKNYAPEASTIAGVAVGAAALSALGANVQHEALSHAVGHASEEAVHHTIGHAASHLHAHAATQAAASSAVASGAGYQQATNFADRFASQAADLRGKSFAERVGGTPARDTQATQAERLSAARQATAVPSAATLG